MDVDVGGMEPPSEFAHAAWVPPVSEASRFSALLLGLSGLGLWGALMGATLLAWCGGTDAGAAGPLDSLMHLLRFGEPLDALALALLAVYAVLERPWRAGLRAGWAFWAQVPLAGAALAILVTG
ncbi:MAG: hypothetical protein GAK40_00449 [Burkholderia plantarii]|nr:MAG: hypothetical protein GAK40_00449 [Burkholderia plantarii]